VARREAEAAKHAAEEQSRFDMAEAEARARAELAARQEGERVVAAAQTAAAAAAAEEASAAAAADKEQREVSAEASKQDGHAAFKEGRYEDAVRHYSEAIESDQLSAVLYSNRSGALAAAGSYEVALTDAERCIALEPQWAKGHTRKAASLHGLKRYMAAIHAYDEALKYEPGAPALLLGRRQSSFALATEE